MAENVEFSTTNDATSGKTIRRINLCMFWAGSDAWFDNHLK